ncbi:MAG: histidine kinase [Rhodothermia bacterium]|nr:histidine kinase [Rhodothermia bacterium]
MDIIIRKIKISIAIVTVFALFPLMPFFWSWYQVTSDIQLKMPENAYRGFDWVQWEFIDGKIMAMYVFPKGTAYEAGIRKGDVLTELDYIRYFDAEAFKTAIDAIQPNQLHRYTILRGTKTYLFDVPFTAYPIFIYPHSIGLWSLSLWGFAVIAFIHFMALGIILPLRNRSAKANLSIGLIGMASIAVFGNLIRLLMLTFGGATVLNGVTGTFFQFLSLIGLVGWTVFPALLLHTVLHDRSALRTRLGKHVALIYLPSFVFVILTLYIFILGPFGPISHKNILPPILFYVYLYIAASMALYLFLDRSSAVENTDEERQIWSRIGSSVLLGLSAMMAILVLTISRLLPVSDFTDVQAGWILVTAQLSSTTPILLVSYAILKYGKVDEVISRYLSFAVSLLAAFVFFLVGMEVFPPFLPNIPTNILSAFWALCMIIAFEWLLTHLQNIISRIISSEKQAVQKSLNRFGEHMFNILDHRVLVSETLEKILQGLQVPSGALFLKAMNPTEQWISRSIQLEPPYFSELQMNRIWEEFADSEAIWTSNAELTERSLKRTTRDLLQVSGFELVIPIPGSNHPVGLLLLSRKRRYQSFYNLGDLEMLRGLCNQLGLVSERIVLIEREKNLIKQHAEAQLVALRAQISPHFLFNTLNTLAALIDENPKEAEKNVQHLAAIFRYVLQTGGNTFATLKAEFGLVEHYLALEQSRFGPDLKIEMLLPSELEQVQIPAFALQTLVENAVKHGLEKSRRRGKLEVSTMYDEERFVVISVKDSGLGIPYLYGQGEQACSNLPFLGTGLKNVADRLVQIYHRSDLLFFSSDPQFGTCAQLKIPLIPPKKLSANDH